MQVNSSWDIYFLTFLMSSCFNVYGVTTSITISGKVRFKNISLLSDSKNIARRQDHYQESIGKIHYLAICSFLRWNWRKYLSTRFNLLFLKLFFFDRFPWYILWTSHFYLFGCPTTNFEPLSKSRLMNNKKNWLMRRA